MQLGPGIIINIKEDWLVVDCALLLYPDSGQQEIVVKTIPTFRFDLADFLEQRQAIMVKAIYQEFTNKTVARKKGNPGTSYQSLAEFRFFISLLQKSMAT
jgi:hypothetical protein